MARTLKPISIVKRDSKGELIPVAGVLDLAFVMRYVKLNLTDQEIGKLCDCTAKQVEKFRKVHGIVGNTIENFKEMKGEVFNHKTKLVVESLTTDKINEMTGIEQVKALDILNKNARLESGQSTTNVAMQIFDAVKKAEGDSDKRGSRE